MHDDPTQSAQSVNTRPKKLPALTREALEYLLSEGFRLGRLTRPHGKKTPPSNWNKGDLSWVMTLEEALEYLQIGNLFLDIPKQYFILDLDIPSSEEEDQRTGREVLESRLPPELRKRGFPQTLTISTPSGGTHHILQAARGGG